MRYHYRSKRCINAKQPQRRSPRCNCSKNQPLPRAAPKNLPVLKNNPANPTVIHADVINYIICRPPICNQSVNRNPLTESSESHSTFLSRSGDQAWEFSATQAPCVAIQPSECPRKVDFGCVVSPLPSYVHGSWSWLMRVYSYIK